MPNSDSFFCLLWPWLDPDDALLTRFGTNFACFGLVMSTRFSLQAQNVHLHITNCEWASPDTSWTDKRPVGEERAGSSTFVLPVITSMCTYNIGALKWGYWVGLNPFIGSFRLLMLAFQVSYNLDETKRFTVSNKSLQVMAQWKVWVFRVQSIMSTLGFFCLQNYQGYIASNLVN
jgi:hypothetical protein